MGRVRVQKVEEARVSTTVRPQSVYSAQAERDRLDAWLAARDRSPRTTGPRPRRRGFVARWAVDPEGGVVVMYYDAASGTVSPSTSLWMVPR